IHTNFILLTIIYIVCVLLDVNILFKYYQFKISLITANFNFYISFCQIFQILPYLNIYLYLSKIFVFVDIACNACAFYTCTCTFLCLCLHQSRTWSISILKEEKVNKKNERCKQLLHSCATTSSSPSSSSPSSSSCNNNN